jgi:multiple sugar transport system ATP-binding protein
MSELLFENVTKVYPDGTKSVDDASFVVPDGSFCVLVGPSGCGKTTLLRMVAGLESVTEGAIRIDGLKVNSLAPKDRDISMVFQNYALYPHLSAFDNIGFSLRMRGESKSVIQERTRSVSGTLALDDYLSKLPKNLSGGQRQRVAMGRALVRDPKVLLMDEPLSNLDARLRAHMRTEIARRHSERHITTVYVTHDQIEAMTLGDVVAVMRLGVIQQVTSPQTLFDRPANVFVASFIGSPAMNMLEGQIVQESGQVRLSVGATSMTIPAAVLDDHPTLRTMSGTVILGIRPDDVRVSSDPRPEALSLRGRVKVVEGLGRGVHIYADIDAPPASSAVLSGVAEDLGDIGESEFSTSNAVTTDFAAIAAAPFPGRYDDEIKLTVAAELLYFFDARSGMTLRG